MSKKNWHPNFIRYMQFIVNHPNYEGLPIEKKEDGGLAWIATKTSEIGKARMAWAKTKAKKLNIKIEPGYYAKTMFEIHPTKDKVCQICGETMSIRYIYPNAWMLKSIIKNYSYEPSIYENMYDICNILLSNGADEIDLKLLIIDKLKLPKDNVKFSIAKLVDIGEELCRLGNRSCFGPGAMSNFPDRYDGFHSYNRCCRSREDTGRHKDNLKSYTKDRRAYENWSDGNIHAANKFMGSSFFKDISADHIGPISLGFVHDPRYLQPMQQGDNSAKRDRLELEDIEQLVQIEKNTLISPISWFASVIWQFIKDNYKTNLYDVELYRTLLKQNMANYMESLWYILDKCNNNGKIFLEHFLLKPKIQYFNYDYEFDINGNIVRESERNYTDATKKEYSRFTRIAFESIEDFHEKENRNIKPNISEILYSILNSICLKINNDPISDDAFQEFKDYVSCMQKELLSEYTA